jgi:hypothetical protein
VLTSIRSWKRYQTSFPRGLLLFCAIFVWRNLSLHTTLSLWKRCFRGATLASMA